MSDTEINRLIVEAAKADRGYAGEFGWPDRDVEEWGVVARGLSRSLEQQGTLFFSDVRARGRGNDPPDCEAIASTGERIAFEVTELVDGRAIQYAKHHGTRFVWAEWPELKFVQRLTALLQAKAKRHDKLKGGPYPGGYVIVVYTAEPNLSSAAVSNYLQNFKTPELPTDTKAYLLLGYTAAGQGNPCFRIA